MKRKIKIKYVDFWDAFKSETYTITELLAKHYDLEFSDKPDFLFYSVYSKNFMKYDCTRIMYSGENIFPDFNLCDYAIGFDKIDMGNRYIYFPNYLMNPKYKIDVERMKNKHLPEHIASKSKIDFCSFVVSNGAGDKIRFKLFNEISKYKPVHSGGRYLNNIGLPSGVPDKYEFQLKHKFSIAAENSAHNGYCTEKLVEAFAAGCIPIYWGDPCVTEIFNEKAMIIVKDESDIPAAIEKIKALDNDERLYKNMLKEPALVKKDIFDGWYEKLESFLCYIIDNPVDHYAGRSRGPFVYGYYQNYFDNTLNKNNFFEKILKIWRLK